MNVYETMAAAQSDPARFARQMADALQAVLDLHGPLVLPGGLAVCGQCADRAESDRYPLHPCDTFSRVAAILTSPSDASDADEALDALIQPKGRTGS